VIDKERYVYNIDRFVKDFDFDLILQEAEDADYSNVFGPGSYDKLVSDSHETAAKWFDNHDWQVSVVKGGEALRLAEKIASILELDVDYLYPQFLKLYKGEELRWHVDKVVKVSMNFVLKGFDTPVQFIDYPDPIYYDAAVLNTREMHCVPFAKNEDRVILKLRIPNPSELYDYNGIVDKFKSIAK